MLDRDDRLAPELERAARLLRTEEPVPPAWRAALLDEIARAPSGRATPRGIHLTIPTAIAAAIVCAVGGASLSYVTTHGVSPAASAASVVPKPVALAKNDATTLPVRFTVAAPQAASVSIVGDFNHWNPTALPMTRSADGTHWEIEVRLPLGRYSYAFLIDGRISPDPAAPQGAGDDFGAPNSVLMVRGS
jgi:hypothetical protein